MIQFLLLGGRKKFFDINKIFTFFVLEETFGSLKEIKKNCFVSYSNIRLLNYS